jgi:hypothetical protein
MTARPINWLPLIISPPLFVIPSAVLKDDSKLPARLRSSNYRMRTERVPTVSATVENSAEDSGHYSIPAFLIVLAIACASGEALDGAE